MIDYIKKSAIEFLNKQTSKLSAIKLFGLTMVVSCSVGNAAPAPLPDCPTTPNSQAGFTCQKMLSDKVPVGGRISAHIEAACTTHNPDWLNFIEYGFVVDYKDMLNLKNWKKAMPKRVKFKTKIEKDVKNFQNNTNIDNKFYVVVSCFGGRGKPSATVAPLSSTLTEPK